MNPELLELEASLKRIRLERPEAAFLERTLAAALAEREAAVSSDTSIYECPPPRAGKRFGVMAAWYRSVPRPVRWAIAACWLLAFLLRLMTPTVEAPTQHMLAKRPAPTREAMLAHQQQVRDLSHELLTKPSGIVPRL